MPKNKNIEKIAFKVVQMKSLAMHITKLFFDIFTVENLQNIFMEHDLYLISMNFGIKEKSIILTYMYCWYKYTRATYDWFCGPGSHIKIEKYRILFLPQYTK